MMVRKDPISSPSQVTGIRYASPDMTSSRPPCISTSSLTLQQQNKTTSPNPLPQFHDEVMEVTTGRMKFLISGKEHLASAGDAPILIPRGTVHGFTTLRGEEVTFLEKTVPSGEYKALFFQDLFQAGTPGPLMALRAFYDGDMYIALPGNFKLLEQVVSFFFFF
jgi:mannose-6-phosphate isomerase-like protein (cupin superfamily)